MKPMSAYEFDKLLSIQLKTFTMLSSHRFI